MTQSPTDEPGCSDELCIGCTSHHWAVAMRVGLCVITIGLSEALRGKDGWCGSCVGPTTQRHQTWDSEGLQRPQQQTERRSSERTVPWAPGSQNTNSSMYPTDALDDRSMSPGLQQRPTSMYVRPMPMASPDPQQISQVQQVGDMSGVKQYANRQVNEQESNYQPLSTYQSQTV